MVAIVVGTRPEIIKMSPVIKACQDGGVEFAIIDTKQHYSDNMSGSFFRDLGLPEPQHPLNTGGGSHGQQMSTMLLQFEELFEKNAFDLVLVQGDTNTVLTAGLMASRANIPVGHVEAGLRSGDRTMPEEINRITVDHISDYLFATSQETLQNLQREGIPDLKIWNTGNTIVDATFHGVRLAEEDRRATKKLPRDYALVTMHRPANVDNPRALTEILDGIQAVMRDARLEVVFPIHPRTRKNIDAAGITLPKGFHLLDPQGYLDFLRLQSQASLILTDSGGVQEEACILQVPCVTLRNNTERPETITVGANALGGTKKSTIVKAARQMLSRARAWNIPYGDGQASKRIVDIVLGKPQTATSADKALLTT